MPVLLGTVASDASISTNSIFEAGDILFGKLRPNLKKSLQVKFTGYCSTDILVFRAKASILPEFAAKVFQREDVFGEAVRTAEGTKMPRTSWEKLKKFRVFVPSNMEEQLLINSILDTIDRAIARTSSLIAKLKQMKAGLLHDLLTRGLDENGELRDAIASPEQFKDSLLGQIPKEWEVARLSQEIDIVHGYAFKGEYFSEQPPGEILLVPGNFHREGGFYFEDNNTKYYRGLIPEGNVLDNSDLLIVMTDLSPKTLILGRVVLLDLPFRVLHNQRIGKIIPKLPNTWNKLFLMLAMNNERVRTSIISNATGTTVRHTSPERIIASIVTKPSIEEQSKVVAILESHDTRLCGEEAYLEKLKLQKKGLVQDLLTGKIRVNRSKQLEDKSELTTLTRA